MTRDRPTSSGSGSGCSAPRRRGCSAGWWLASRTSPAGFELDLAGTAAELGIAAKAGQHSPFVRSIHRCCRFGAAEVVDDATLRVRRKLPPLTRAQIERLPERLRAAHEQWQARTAPGTTVSVEHLRNRARHLALSLLELGEDGEATERQLHRWRVHPAMAHDATAWALARHRSARAAADPTGPPPAAA